MIEEKQSIVSLGKCYDLHSHTTASDGVLTPTELVCRAVEMKVDVLAISDHDTLSGLAEAQETINSKNLPLQLVPAVELSTVWQNVEIHIVGLNLNVDNNTLLELLERQSQRRQQRAEIMAQRLSRQLDRPELPEKVMAMSHGGVITRAHFARYLLENGVVSSFDHAFRSYLSKKHPAYVESQWCTIQDAVHAINTSGGQAILAHPIRYKLPPRQLKKLLADFKQCGGRGMEVAACQLNQQERHKLAKYAIEYGLYASQGSDFHHPCPWLELGRNLWLPGGVIPIWHDCPAIAGQTQTEQKK